MRLPGHSRWLLLPIAALATGCDDVTPPIGFCAGVAPIAIEVDVTDSVTGLARADSASGFIQSGAQIDSLRHDLPSATLLFGGTQRGTYDVTVSRPGYTNWTRTAVAVTQIDQCGTTVPVHLSALLQPTP